MPLFETGDEKFTGKTLSALHKSRKGHNALIALFGKDSLPSSVMIAKKRTPTDEVDAPATERSYTETSPHKDNPIRSFQISGRGCGAGALSTFPQNVGRSTVLLYSEPGNVIFDPHAGHNSRMELCVKIGRHYIGCDISTEFMKFNRKRAAQLRKRYPGARIELHEGDSREITTVGDSLADFSLTSPPYYDIEYYGDEEGQLGKAPTYKEFLAGMQQVISETFRILKPGAYSVWFINDFRRKGKIHFYHMDILRLGKKAGFIPHDLMVVDFGRTMRDCFLNQAVEQKILPKRHEFGVVFRKPE